MVLVKWKNPEKDLSGSAYWFGRLFAGFCGLEKHNPEVCRCLWKTPVKSLSQCAGRRNRGEFSREQEHTFPAESLNLNVRSELPPTAASPALSLSR
jgi:hypothetical protein